MVNFVNIFIQLNTIYYEKGEPVALSSKIIKRFVKKQLLREIISCFNFFVAICRLFVDDITIWVEYIQLPLVFLWIRKIDKMEKTITDYLQLSEFSTYIFKIIKLLAVVVIISHWMGCIWFLILKFDNQANSFFRLEYVYPVDLPNMYMATFYWVITVMATVGFGELAPVSIVQKVTSIVFILLSTCTFAYTVNTIGNIYDERMQIGNMKKIKLVELNEYLRAKNVSRDLQVTPAHAGESELLHGVRHQQPRQVLPKRPRHAQDAQEPHP